MTTSCFETDSGPVLQGEKRIPSEPIDRGNWNCSQRWPFIPPSGYDGLCSTIAAPLTGCSRETTSPAKRSTPVAARVRKRELMTSCCIGRTRFGEFCFAPGSDPNASSHGEGPYENREND